MKIWDTSGLTKHEREIEGFLDGTEFDQILYSALMAVGVISILLAYPSTFYNERKYLNLKVNKGIIDDKLYEAKNVKNHTDKENENKLVFAQGSLKFAQPATDDELQFTTSKGLVLHRNVEIYQWVRTYDWNAKECRYETEPRYQKIWA